MRERYNIKNINLSYKNLFFVDPGLVASVINKLDTFNVSLACVTSVQAEANYTKINAG